MNTSKRIESIIKQLGLNNSSFAKKINVSSTTVDGYTKGRKNAKGDIIISQPSYDAIKSMVVEFNINADYILGVSDEMFKGNKNAYDTKEELLDYIIINSEEFRNEPKLDAVVAIFANYKQQNEMLEMKNKITEIDNYLSKFKK